jgi:hypothetical protein
MYFKTTMSYHLYLIKMAKPRSQTVSDVGVYLQTWTFLTLATGDRAGQPFRRTTWQGLVKLKAYNTPDLEIPLFYQHFYSLSFVYF